MAFAARFFYDMLFGVAVLLIIFNASGNLKKDRKGGAR